MDKPLELQQAWLLAIQKEQEARATYIELSEMTDDAAIKSLFDFLAGQEAEHERRLQEEYDKVFLSDF
jgi:rubrerythrin